jgi:molybdopterin-containing oxidoreductase family iron-sulfur binding subunit
MPKYGMAIDLDKCFGCRACMVACKVENNTPEANFWMYVFRLEEGEFPNSKVTFLPRPCMHCDNAPCVKVCPVGARFKQEDGIVCTDWDRCIGCRYCEVACPYGVNYFNWKDPKKAQYLEWDDPELTALTGGGLPYANPDLEGGHGTENRKIAGGNHHKGVVEKCTLCVHRVEKGLDPACAANCPAFALVFGDLDDPDSNVSKLLAQKPSFRLEEEFDTEPRIHYVGGTHPSTEVRQIETVKARP